MLPVAAANAGHGQRRLAELGAGRSVVRRWPKPQHAWHCSPAAAPPPPPPPPAPSGVRARPPAPGPAPPAGAAALRGAGLCRLTFSLASPSRHCRRKASLEAATSAMPRATANASAKRSSRVSAAASPPPSRGGRRVSSASFSTSSCAGSRQRQRPCSSSCARFSCRRVNSCSMWRHGRPVEVRNWQE